MPANCFAAAFLKGSLFSQIDQSEPYTISGLYTIMEKQSLYYLLQDITKTFAKRPVYWVRTRERGRHRAISFLDWYADIKRFSAYLLYRLKVEHGERIALFCGNRYEWNLLCLAIDTIGAVDVPRNCDAPRQEMEHILNHSGVRVVIVENENMLAKLVDSLPRLEHIKDILSIENPQHYEKLPLLKSKLKEIKLHSLIDALSIGEEFLVQNGEALLKERGQAILPNDLAAIIYTSGTSAKAKGAALEHRNFCWPIARFQEATALRETDRSVVFLPPANIAERIWELALLSCGASIAPSQIGSLLHDFAFIKPTVLLAVPSIWKSLHKRVYKSIQDHSYYGRTILGGRSFSLACHAASMYRDIVDTLNERFAEYTTKEQNQKYMRKLIAFLLWPLYALLNPFAQFMLRRVKAILGGQLRFAVSGGGSLDEASARFFRSVGLVTLNAYGMTESSGLGVLGSLPYPKREALGKPFPEIEVELRDAAGSPISEPGLRGILYQKGPHIMQSYYKDPDLTHAVLQDGWLESGDIFTWSTEGELRFIGRAKDTIVLSSGENVEPLPIEESLLENEYINQVVVVGQDKKRLGALIYPDQERLREKFKQENEELLIEEDPQSWNQNKKICNFYRSILKERVSELHGFRFFEKITVFYLLPQELSVGRELNYVMKLKRNTVAERYAQEIEAMYK